MNTHRLAARPATRKTYSIAEVAAVIGRTEKYVRACIHSLDSSTHRPLAAKKWPDGKYFVTDTELDRWINSHEEA